MGEIERFIIRENIDRFAEHLAREADSDKRSTLFRLLIAEEDKLGKDLEQLAAVERCIREIRAKIARQRDLLERLATETEALRLANTLLVTLENTHALLDGHRDRLNGEIERSSL